MRIQYISQEAETVLATGYQIKASTLLTCRVAARLECRSLAMNFGETIEWFCAGSADLLVASNSL